MMQGLRRFFLLECDGAGPADALQAAQTSLLYDRLPTALVINVLLAPILVLVESDVVGPARWLTWLIIMAAVILARLALAVAWRRGKPVVAKEIPCWLRRFRVGVIAIGIAWGLSAVLLFPSGNEVHQVALSFVLAGMSSGAITLLAVDQVSMLGFLVPTLLPLAVRFALEGTTIAASMAIMVALFLVFIAINASRIGHSLLENFQLRIRAVEREQELRQSEARLNQAQHTAHVGNWELDLVNDKLYWSDEIFRIFEIDQTRITPSYEIFLNAIHPDDRAMVDQAYADSLATRTPYDLVHRLLFAHGHIKYVHERCETVFDVEGKPLRSLGTVQDITQQQLAENSLRESEARYRAVTETASDAIIISDKSEKVVGWNRGAERIFGYPAVKIIGQPVTVLMPQRYRAQHLAAIARMLKGGKPRISGSGPIELAGLHKDGSEFPLEMSLAQWESGGEIFFTGIVRDITERKKGETELKESEARFRFMLENSPIAARITRVATSEVVFANQRYATMINSLPERVIGLKPEQYYVNPRDHAEVMERLRRGERITNRLVELRIPNPYSKTTWVLASYLSLAYQNEPAILGWFYDISDRKAMEERVLHLAHFDALTDLPNRTLFADRLRQALAIDKREHEHLALLFLDLDKFKPINDSLGHDVGDLVLKAVAQRIQDCLRESDTVARLGGDEFVVLLPTVAAPQDAIDVAEKIRYLLNQPFELAGHMLNISSSTGVAIYPEHGTDERELTRSADTAMYYAKSVGRDNVQLYRPDMLESSENPS